MAVLSRRLGQGGELCEILPSTALSRVTEQHRESSLEVTGHEMCHEDDSDFLPLHKRPVFKMKS